MCYIRLMLTHFLATVCTFVLVTSYPSEARVTILHSDQVKIRAPECDRVDDWVDKCTISASKTELTITAPCWMRQIELFTSARHSESKYDNRKVVMDNPTPCAATVYIPAVQR